MEIKLRRKGEVITVDGFVGTNIPEEINVPEGLEGIDLTRYPVIYSVFGRHGREKAEALHAKAPGAFLVYQYEWRNGWGQGILLPDRFNPSRVLFYKTAAQEEEERKTAAASLLKELRASIVKTIPDIRAFSDEEHGYVVVTPEQLVRSDWSIQVKSLEDALSGVEAIRPLWEEWNVRASEAFARHFGQHTNNIRIDPSPAKASKVWVNDGDRYIEFRLQEDGSWAEIGETQPSVFEMMRF